MPFYIWNLALSAIWNLSPRLSGLGLGKAGLLCSTRRCKNKHGHKTKYLTARNVLKVIKVKYYFQLSLYARIKLSSRGCRNKVRKWVIHYSTYASCRRCLDFLLLNYWWSLCLFMYILTHSLVFMYIFEDMLLLRWQIFIFFPFTAKNTLPTGHPLIHVAPYGGSLLGLWSTQNMLLKWTLSPNDQNVNPLNTVECILRLFDW